MTENENTGPTSLPASRESALEGLSPDLIDAIKKYGHLIPASRAVNFVLAATEYPSDTASAMTNVQWMEAWIAEWQRANRAEAEADELREALEAAQDQCKRWH